MQTSHESLSSQDGGFRLTTSGPRDHPASSALRDWRRLAVPSVTRPSLSPIAYMAVIRLALAPMQGQTSVLHAQGLQVAPWKLTHQTRGEGCGIPHPYPSEGGAFIAWQWLFANNRTSNSLFFKILSQHLYILLVGEGVQVKLACRLNCGVPTYFWIPR